MSKPADSANVASLRPSLEYDRTGEGKSDRQTAASPPDSVQRKASKQGHQKLVFSDPVAFRYLEEDPSTTVLDRRRRLPGYEIYIVEQWACSRTHPTFIIAAYTGDMSHSILVNVLSVPMDEKTWSSRLKIFNQAVSQAYARTKETPFGDLMVTNLSSFPSSLTVIAVPDGDVRKHREDFIVNENLKRLGCSGRAGLNLQQPLPSTIAKYHHLYRTSESVPLYASVMEMVKLCQTALILFGKLLPAYADGLLCDVTEKAITEWWTDIGTYIYNIEPSDGILGPTTVAALLGLLIGAYNRLKATGAPVGKDVLDVLSMKRAIGSFQGSQKLEKTRRLDHATIEKLHRATAKSANNDGWTVPKAVKSTVAELSGKGGEMVMGIVGRGDKSGIADVETYDMDRFVELVTSPKMKWLWQGKAIKSTGLESFGAPADDLLGRVFRTDDSGGYMWTTDKRNSVFDNNLARRMEGSTDHHVSDSKSGFDRLRDVVGIRSHHTKQIKEENEREAGQKDNADPSNTPRETKESKPSRDHVLRSRHSTSHISSKSLEIPIPFNTVLANANLNVSQKSFASDESDCKDIADKSQKQVERTVTQASKDTASLLRREPTRMSSYREAFKADVYQNFSSEYVYSGPRHRRLRRTQSAIQIVPLEKTFSQQHRLPRHLSFDMIQTSIFTHRDALADSEDDEGETSAAANKSPIAAFKALETDALASQRKAKRLLYMQQVLTPFVDNWVSRIESLDGESHAHIEELNNLYYERLEEYQALRHTSTDVMRDEKAALNDSLRRVEMLGAKLDYELSSLTGRVKEVEEGVNEFERAVVDIEARVSEFIGDDLDDNENKAMGWLGIIGRFVGKGRELVGGL